MVLFYGSRLRNGWDHDNTLLLRERYRFLIHIYEERYGGLRSGMRRTVLPSLRAWIFSFSRIGEPVQRSGGTFPSVHQ